VLIAIIIAGIGCRPKAGDDASQPKSLPDLSDATDSVQLIIDYAQDYADTAAMILQGEDSLTVLDLLMGLTARDSINILVTEYPFGVLIEQIGARRNGDGGYWVYTVNDEAIPKAASAYAVPPGDTVRFLFK